MKPVLLVVLLCPIFCQAQLKKSYLQMYGGLSWSNEATTKGIAGLSVGPRLGDAIGVGIGVGFIQFEKPYVPLTIDFSLIPTVKKINPVAGVKGGYGIFNYKPSSSTTVQGGFVISVFAGVTLPGRKLRPNIMVGGTRYSFKENRQSKTVITDDKRIFATIGILF
jgi:hypothetical protein